MSDENKPLKTAQDVLLTWMKAVNDGRLDDILSLYNQRANLLPTFSPIFIAARDDLTDYFVQLAARPNLHVDLKVETLEERPLGSQFAVATGLYSFSFDAEDGRETVPSRFTFVVDLADPAPIMHHHSSALPVVP